MDGCNMRERRVDKLQLIHCVVEEALCRSFLSARLYLNISFV